MNLLRYIKESTIVKNVIEKVGFFYKYWLSCYPKYYVPSIEIFLSKFLQTGGFFSLKTFFVCSLLIRVSSHDQRLATRVWKVFDEDHSLEMWLTLTGSWQVMYQRPTELRRCRRERQPMELLRRPVMARDSRRHLQEGAMAVSLFRSGGPFRWQWEPHGSSTVTHTSWLRWVLVAALGRFKSFHTIKNWVSLN